MTGPGPSEAAAPGREDEAVSGSPIKLDDSALENGLALMLTDLLTQNMEQAPKKQQTFKRMKAVVAISAGDAEVDLSLHFDRGRCTIKDGVAEAADLHIQTDSDTVLELSALSINAGLPNFFNRTGRGVAGKLFKGELKIRGMVRHPVSLIRLTKIFSVN